MRLFISPIKRSVYSLLFHQGMLKSEVTEGDRIFGKNDYSKNKMN